MKKALIIGLLVVALLCLPSCVSQEEIASANTDSVFEAELFDLINQVRVDEGLCELTPDPALCAIALDYCKEMYQEDMLTHDGFADRASAVLLCGYTRFGENLARGYNSPEDLVNDWLSSPSHAENIMNPLFSHVGLVCYNGYICQIFGGYDFLPSSYALSAKSH